MMGMQGYDIDLTDEEESLLKLYTVNFIGR